MRRSREAEAAPGLPTAWLRSRWPMVVAVVLLLIVAAWTMRHLWQVFGLAGLDQGRFAVLWALVFGSLVFHLVLAWSNRPVMVTAAQEVALDRYKVVVAIPAFNEDPEALSLSIRSLFRQTRRPDVIHVVDDGSTASLESARDTLFALAAQYDDVQVEWTRTENRGKRHAQIEVFDAHPDADILATMDSDTILDPECIRNGLHPFSKPKVTSVASVILAYNNRNWFVRLTDSWLLAFQMVVRSAMSRMGAVLVNSGNFSLYRASVVREYMPAYRDETFRGNTVMFSDDSLLTLFAHLEGHTVQQENSIAFTVLPENVSHHLRQQVRWMRGSTIRSMWRFKYLPFKGVAYWEHFASWVNFVLITIAFVYILVVLPFITGQFDPTILLFSAVICYLTAVRYLVVARSDQSIWFQLGTVALAPIMLAWTALVLRPMRLYSIFTCYRTGWGTREKVEVVTAV